MRHQAWFGNRFSVATAVSGTRTLATMLSAGVCLLIGLGFFQSTDSSAVVAQEPANELAEFYGFRSLEIFKLATRSGNMVSGDLNHDGLMDLAIVDNSNSRIDMLLQRKKTPDQKEKSTTKDVNSFKGDWRFEHKKFSVDKALSALSLGDFNGDGRTDMAYIGLPDRLVIKLQPESGEWKNGPTFRLPDLQLAQWMMSSGDLNHDGKDDLVILGKSFTFLLYQKEGELQIPERLMNTSDKLGLIQIGDLDGDGRTDLSYLANDDTGRSLCARFQTASGRMGPELRFDLDKPRSTSIKDMDGQPGFEIISIHGQTGRVRIHQVRRPEAKTGELAGQLVQYGFGQQAGSTDRDLATGDVNGDGLTDIVVTDPEASQILVFNQLPGVGLDQGTSFPSLTGATQVRVGDFLQDKSNEVVVLSPKEKSIGVSRLEAGRLTFPQAVPVEKEPVVFALADLNGDKSPEIVYITRDRAATKTGFLLKALQAVKKDDQIDWQPLGAGTTLTLKADPEQLLAYDADRDGVLDFLVFQGTERPALLVKSDGKGGLAELTPENGFSLGNIAATSAFSGQLDGPALLVAHNNFARHMRLNEKNQWRVMDQFSVVESSAKIVGTATLNLDGKPGNELVLIDQGVKKLRVLKAENKTYRPWKEVDIGPFPYRGSHVADLNADGLDDLLLFGGGKFGVLYANQSDPSLNELATFETNLEDSYLADAVAGDLNHDGRMDLAVLETKSHHVEILDFSKELGLRHAMAFKLFESKGVSEREQSQTEPREALIVDLTGDGLDDLVLLSHDRVILYPQDDGK
jgi:hypothetical protein